MANFFYFPEELFFSQHDLFNTSQNYGREKHSENLSEKDGKQYLNQFYHYYHYKYCNYYYFYFKTKTFYADVKQQMDPGQVSSNKVRTLIFFFFFFQQKHTSRLENERRERTGEVKTQRQFEQMGIQLIKEGRPSQTTYVSKAERHSKPKGIN